MPRETPSARTFSHRGEWEHSEWVSNFPSCARHCPEGSILPCPTQSTEASSKARRFREVRAQKQGLRTHQRAMEALQIPSRNSLSCLGHLIYGPLSLVHRHPQCSLCFTYPCVPPQPAREAFADGSHTLQKASPALQVWEKEYKLEHFMALLWGKQTEDSQHWPDFVGLRQGIKS